MFFSKRPDWLVDTQNKVAVISDLHLFRFDAHPKQAYHYLEKNRCETLVILGDAIEGFEPQLGRPSEWTLRFFDLVNQRRAVEGMKLTVLRGNHDQYLVAVMGQLFDDIEFKDDMVLEGGGQKTLLTHGHVFDEAQRRENELALYLAARKISFGGVGAVQLYNYGLVLKNKLSSRFNYAVHAPLPHQNQMTKLLEERDCDALLCGHFHHAQNFQPLGHTGKTYGNSGAMSGGMVTAMELGSDDQWRLNDWRVNRKLYGMDLPRKKDRQIAGEYDRYLAPYREQTMHQIAFHRALQSVWMAGQLLEQFDHQVKNAKDIRSNLEDLVGMRQEAAKPYLRQLVPAPQISMPEQSLAA